MRHIIPISGKDSLATAILQKRLYPYYEYEYIFNPTGKELPETIEWIKKVETYLQKPILFIGFDMRETNEWKKGFRPSIFKRWCTNLCKIKPMEDYFDCEAYVYYGLRSDEPERIGFINNGKSELTPKYPLRENNIDIFGVLEICKEANLMPPTFEWDILKNAFIKIYGLGFLNEQFNEHQLMLLFAGRSRNNCYDCFNMKKIEWVWLSIVHPDIFWRVVDEEEVLGTREKPFSTIKDYPLRQLHIDRFEIIDKHIKRTCRHIERLKQYSLFDKNNLFEDLLTYTSCGLLCGK